MRNIIMKVHIKTIEITYRTIGALRNNKGESFIDTAVKILISVVIGGLILSGLYMLFKDTILPTLEDRIIDMFDFQG